MCRMMGYVAKAATGFRDLLGANAFQQFVALSLEHKDGWGIAWQEGEGYRLEKAPEQAEGSAHFQATVGAVRSPAAILHLRLASVGELTRENTHPFLEGRYAFCHNGSIDLAVFSDSRLPKVPAGRGETDSERYFQVLLRLVAEGRSVPEAAQYFARVVVAGGYAFSSLNFLLLSDEALYAFCRFHPEAKNVQKDKDYYVLRHTRLGDAWVVASSGWAEGDRWQSAQNGECLIFDRRTNACERRLLDV